MKKKPARVMIVPEDHVLTEPEMVDAPIVFREATVPRERVTIVLGERVPADAKRRRRPEPMA